MATHTATPTTMAAATLLLSRNIMSVTEINAIPDMGEMSVIPRGVSHKNVGHGSNIEITIYTKKPLQRMCPSDPEQARIRMKMKGGKPVHPPATLDDPAPQ